MLAGRLGWILHRRRSAVTKMMAYAAWTSTVDSASHIGRYAGLYPWSQLVATTIGDFSYLARGARAVNAAIGKFTCIGPETLIGGLAPHPLNWISIHPSFYSMQGQVRRTFVEEQKFNEVRSTCVGNDVWIGARALILDGVTIGNGAVIAAGSVVVKDVAPYTVAGGIPAKPLRTRFDIDICERLEKLKWWDYEPEVLAAAADEFTRKSGWTLSDIDQLEQRLASYTIAP